MKVIKTKIDKKDIAKMPVAAFKGKIVLIDTMAEAEKAVFYLMKQPLVGLDTETRPSFRKGTSYKVALMQVCAGEDICFLFRLNRLGMIEPLRKLMEAERPLKVGVSLRDDILSLHRREDFNPRGIVELQKRVKEIGIEDMSLQKLFANFFQRKISKSQQLTNWEAKELTPRQQLYAATDAWACIEIYKELNRLEAEGSYRLEIVPEPNVNAKKPEPKENVTIDLPA